MDLSGRVLALIKERYPWHYARALEGSSTALDELIEVVANETALMMLLADSDF